MSKSSEGRRGSPFSLSRLLPSRRRSKSRFSLDSEASREGGAACKGSSPTLVAYAAASSSYLQTPALSPGFASPVVTVHRSANIDEGQGRGDDQEAREKRERNPSSVDSLDAEDGGETIECLVCLQEKPQKCFPVLSMCNHHTCRKCLKEYFRTEIMESRVGIACPECSELFHPNDIYAIVQDQALMQKYEDFMLRRVLAMDSDTRWCPAPDCGFAVIATGCAGCPKLKCEREGCNTYFCYHCKQYWHPSQTCDKAREERLRHIRSASLSYSQESNFHNEVKPCPRCGAFIMKMDDGSCNHIVCALCGAGFCWLCMQEVSDLHYLSPTGCTFWGRKPWSRKKKILWQLATLVGAPVGITLVAGFSIPAMVIGIPVWVGRKLHYRYKQASKHKRNIVMTTGISASILAAPIIAGLVVGIGVPVLLGYVYCTVPISLCRSGGCDMTATNRGGVRFEFDEENDVSPQGPYSITGDTHSLETAAVVANPSIAPSIGDASLGMTNSLSASGSHMERAGVLRDDSDRDSASHKATAGSSISGSLCSATYSVHHHKLGVHGQDVLERQSHGERSSVGGESYNISLNDDASTKALAGSLVSKDKDGISLCSRHFDGASSSNCPDEAKDEDVAATRGSSSCPTSPNLRKSSPAPTEDSRSNRSKKCTRFMDQVSEIEALSEAQEKVVTTETNTAPVLSTLSLTASSPSQPAALASCESLMSEGRANGLATLSSDWRGGRVKAESTSMLMDGVDTRRSELAGITRSRKRSEDSVFWTKKRGEEKENRSQPGNLSDISEVSRLAPLHASGCSNLAVMDSSNENVFRSKSSQISSSLSSVDEPFQLHFTHKSGPAALQPIPDLERSNAPKFSSQSVELYASESALHPIEQENPVYPDSKSKFSFTITGIADSSSAAVLKLPTLPDVEGPGSKIGESSRNNDRQKRSRTCLSDRSEYRPVKQSLKPEEPKSVRAQSMYMEPLNAGETAVLDLSQEKTNQLKSQAMSGDSNPTVYKGLELSLPALPVTSLKPSSTF